MNGESKITDVERGISERDKGIQDNPIQQKKCSFDYSNALIIEREDARTTLIKSVNIARKFIASVGAVGARGKFVPTVLDNKYWFAKLYEIITYQEILQARRFKQPSFIFHFIPIFYNMYLDALENYLRGELNKINPLWLFHFRKTNKPDIRSFENWQRDIQNSIVSGVEAHIKGDMAIALEKTFRSYIKKYCLSGIAFDSFRVDFFENNIHIFEVVQADFYLEIVKLGPFPVKPEIGQFIIAKGAQVTGALNLEEVFQWRAVAWREARALLAK